MIHVPYSFDGGRLGGTEVYVSDLVAALRERGVAALVAAPSGEEAESISGRGLARRYAVSWLPGDLVQLYGEGDEAAARNFGAILDEEAPDLVHLHAYSRGVSLRLLRACKKRGLPVVFTYHTPTVTCARGTLMRWGVEVCQGVLERAPCVACVLNGLGVPRPATHLLAAVPESVGRACGRFGLAGGLFTAIRMPHLIRLRHSAVRAFLAELDHIVVPCEWARALILGNGVDPAKVTVSRQGLSSRRLRSASESKREMSRSGDLRVAFLGRLDPVKGVDLILQAVRALPGAPVTLHIYGVNQGGTSNAYLRRLLQVAAGDPRIQFRPAVPPEEVVRLLTGYDVVAVPSRGLETGPLVVLEAFAAGVPVLGSNLGGIAELVRDGVDGVLVDALDPRAWQRALEILISAPGFVAKLRGGVRRPRSMADVAVEMESLYRSLLRSRDSAPSLLV